MDLITAERTLYTNSFKAFVKWAWSHVTPYPLVWGKHLDALTDHLQAIRDGKITNLLVNLPPRHSKSIVCTILFPVWLWLSDPSEAVLSASFAMDLATEHSGKSRKLVESDDFKRLFPWVALEDGSNAQDRFKTVAGGGRKAVSVGAGTTGFDATVVIVDDLHSIKKKESETERHNALEYFRNDLSSRGVLGRRVRTVVVGQRVHADDVSGLVIDQFREHPDWSFLTLPLEYDPDREQLRNGLGWTDWRTERGEILFPETVTPAMVAGFKSTARHSYQCLYNQDTINRAGDLFKAEWFDDKHRYRVENGNYVLADGRAIRPESCARAATVDIAVATGNGNDWTVCVVGDQIGPDLIVRHVHRERLDGVRFGPTIRAIYEIHKPAFVAVEQAGQQKIYVDQLRAAGVCVRAVKVTQDKETRSIPLQVRMESGNVWFPHSAPWFADLEAEMLAFPRGRFDDQVDALSMLGALQRFSARPPISDEDKESREREAAERYRYEMLMSGIV